MMNGMQDESIGYDISIEQLARMRHGTQWRWPIEFKTLMVLLRPLTISEDIEVEARVVTEMKSKPAQYRVPMNESAMRAKIILEMASTSAPGKTDPQLTDHILSQCTNAEVVALMKEYSSICDKCDPSIESLSREQIDRMVELLKKTPPEAVASELTGLSFSQARDLLTYLTVECLQKDKSPGG